MGNFSFIVLITALAGAYMAWNIGANDVANAMGTSVGSKAIKLRTALWLAAIMNFLGAYLVGPNVSATLRGKLIDPAVIHDPQIFLYGMLAALLGSSIWLNFATYRGWPVSTTHSIVGAIIGFGLITYGPHAINWSMTGQIVASWIISPVSGGVISSLVFLVIVRLIFFASKPIEAAKKWIPWIVASTIIILVLSLLYKGLQNLRFCETPENPMGIPLCSTPKQAGVLPLHSEIVFALIAGAVALILSFIWMKRIPYRDDDSTRTQKFKIVERIFSKLQIASACYVAFATGANDVANAIGPVAAAVDITQKGIIVAESPIPTWLLLWGGAFIAVGIILYGWKVIVTIGERITGMSPSRGFAAEFGAATTVLICSQMGLPISTTHTLVGSVIGVGFARGMKALNMDVVKKIVASWLYTIPFAAALTIIIFYILRFILAR